jgi:hypothetical protein
LGAPRRCTPKGLAKIGAVREARYRQIIDLPAPAGYADPPLRRVLRFYGFGVAPRVKGTHTRSIPRVPRACPIIASSSTRAGYALVRKGGARLEDIASRRVF